MTNKIKEYWGKFWFLLWKDNSMKGWIFSLIFLFIFIKFIFFPILSLTTGTQLPLAIVESCSMYHRGNFFTNYDSWWDRNSWKYEPLVTSEEFSQFPFYRGFNKGDILFIIGANPDYLKIGEVIIFDGGQANPIIHRIINIREENEKKYFLQLEIIMPDSYLLRKTSRGVKLWEKQYSELLLILGGGNFYSLSHLNHLLKEDFASVFK